MKKEKIKPGYHVLNNAMYILKNIWKTDKMLIIYMVLEAICGVLTPFFGIYLPKIVIDQLTIKAPASQMLIAVGSFTGLMAAVYLIHRFVSGAKYWRAHFTRMNYIVRLYSKTLDCDYEHIESAAGQTRYQKALNSLTEGDWSGVSRMIPSICNLAIGILGFLLYSGVLSGLNIAIILLLTVTSFINYFVMNYTRNYIHKNKDNWALIDKKLGYIGNKSADFTAGKDIRLYRMKSWFLKTRDALLNQRTEWDIKIQNRHLLNQVTNAFIILLRDGLAYAYLIYRVASRTISVADFVLYFGIIAGFSGWVVKLIDEANEISSANLLICDMREFLELPDGRNPERGAILPEPSNPVKIVFKDVYFAYGKQEGNVLHHFNLEIDAGEKIAVVGVNGAGKTTLVKLLCGFYKPDAGQILINGIDIANFKKEDLFSIFSAVFQDIVILPFTVAENIALCQEKDIDKQRVSECLVLAGLNEHIERIPKGIDAPMLKVTEEDGILLSGGQQQKLLLARALYKNAPVLILDEPTAALDPIAESELYEKYHSLTKDKTSIFISHRLASTRFCDKIIFINNGIVAETGTHEELMKQQGEYAKMFDIQSHYYKQSV